MSAAATSRSSAGSSSGSSSRSASRRWVVLLKAGALMAAKVFVELLHIAAVVLTRSGSGRGSSGSSGDDG